MPNTKLLGPPTRSLERVLSRTDVTPTRLLRVMWPVQRVEVEAESVEYQSFDLIDRFVLRAVAECELSRKSDIAAFLGVSEALIAGACAFLTQIQHLTQIGDLITITVFGRRSLASGSREVPQKSRLYLLFDGVTAQPLPRDYHRGDLTYDPEPSNREWERIPAYAPFLSIMWTGCSGAPTAATSTCPRTSRPCGPHDQDRLHGGPSGPDP